MMKSTIVSCLAAGAIAAVGLATPSFAAAQEHSAGQETKAEKKQPFHGKVEAVDTEAKTLTVGGKVIGITDATKLTRAGKSITLGAVKVGEEAHGMTHQIAGGKTEALTVNIGPEEKQKN
jgi:hypothetical protein